MLGIAGNRRIVRGGAGRPSVAASRQEGERVVGARLAYDDCAKLVCSCFHHILIHYTKSPATLSLTRPFDDPSWFVALAARNRFAVSWPAKAESRAFYLSRLPVFRKEILAMTWQSRLQSLVQKLFRKTFADGLHRQTSGRRRLSKPPILSRLEVLEDRIVPANFTSGDLVVLQAAASASNTTGSILELSPTTVNQSSPVADGRRQRHGNQRDPH